uniref:C2H2-type domain-containing protein n=1 Tax=Varanus komodoensis TaxID=61221 RepID=A0A8D2Q5V3_VARKO
KGWEEQNCGLSLLRVGVPSPPASGNRVLSGGSAPRAPLARRRVWALPVRTREQPPFEPASPTPEEASGSLLWPAPASAPISPGPRAPGLLGGQPLPGGVGGPRNQDLQLPKRRPTPGKRYQCSGDGCRLACRSMKELLDHMRVHYRPTQSVEGKAFRCSAHGCAESFPDMQALMGHVKAHYKLNRYFKCENCMSRFQTYRSLFKHLHSCTDSATSSPSPAPAAALAADPLPASLRGALESVPALAHSFPLLEQPLFGPPSLARFSGPPPPPVAGPFLPFVHSTTYGLPQAAVQSRLRPLLPAPGLPVSNAVWKKSQGERCTGWRSPQVGPAVPGSAARRLRRLAPPCPQPQDRLVQPRALGSEAWEGVPVLRNARRSPTGGNQSGVGPGGACERSAMHTQSAPEARGFGRPLPVRVRDVRPGSSGRNRVPSRGEAPRPASRGAGLWGGAGRAGALPGQASGAWPTGARGIAGQAGSRALLRAGLRPRAGERGSVGPVSLRFRPDGRALLQQPHRVGAHPGPLHLHAVPVLHGLAGGDDPAHRRPPQEPVPTRPPGG